MVRAVAKGGPRHIGRLAQRLPLLTLPPGIYDRKPFDQALRDSA